MSQHQGFSSATYVLHSTRYYWRVNTAVLLGILVGTAVLSGALVVGDSVRYSLQRLTLERLGKIDLVLVADQFFSPTLAKQLQLSEQESVEGLDSAVPVVLMPQATVEKPASDQSRRAGSVTIVGCDDRFWQFNTAGRAPSEQPGRREVVLNQPLADELGAQVGDRIVIRLPKASRVASDSPLGDKSNRVRSVAELKVIDILPAEGLGRFSLQANQALPRTAFVAPQTIQQALDRDGQVNAVLVGGRDPTHAPSRHVVAMLGKRMKPRLDDAGLRLKEVDLKYWDEAIDATSTAFSYLSLSTDAMLFSPATERAILAALKGRHVEPVLTYLANDIERAANSQDVTPIPYSTVSAVDDGVITPLVLPDGTHLGPLADDEIVLNQWAADDSGAEIGDAIRIDFFAPETTHGKVESRRAEFRLKAIMPLTRPLLPYTRKEPARFLKPPTRANDPDLTPTVPGITDQESIAEWDPPFPFDYGRIRQPQDDDYWDEYRTTPKAFIGLEAGRKLWGSRFGKTTSFRIENPDPTALRDVEQSLADAIQLDPESFGFRWLHVKRDGLKASRGTTPFNVLFLGFSSFIIAAAVMLVSLLLRLGLEQRAEEAGLLLATGISRRRMFKLFLQQGAILTVCGVILGSLLGIAYAELMIAGLRSWWLDAVVTPFLQLHVQFTTLLLGAFIGAIVCYLTIRWTVARFARTSVRKLMLRQMDDTDRQRAAGKYKVIAIRGFAAMAATCALAAVFLSGEAQAGAFFGSGASTLAALLLQTSISLAATDRPTRNQALSMMGFVLRSIGRHPSRSVLTIGLVATASFLIVAISAFRLSPTAEGTGGFQLIGQSDVAIFDDLNDVQTRQDLLASRAPSLDRAKIFSLRWVAGDDASCRNLYQAQQPRLIGVTRDFVGHFDKDDSPTFGWVGSAAVTDDQRRNPWRLLDQELGETVPVILDRNTAMYSLHLYGGVGEEFEITYDSAGTIRFRVVGLLANTMLQGSLLVGEPQLLQHFPQVGGYRFFLVQCEPDQQDDVQSILQDVYTDQGLLLTGTAPLLRDLLAVQNTYLSTFQSLGGLGLLLGTLGLVSVQMRNVFERRREFALMRAIGFSRDRLSRFVLLEHFVLLLSGLAMGVLAALVSVVPHAWSTEVRTPWATILVLLTTILAVGLLTGIVALRPIVRAPLAGVLRDD